jgi:hypothetical protein
VNSSEEILYYHHFDLHIPINFRFLSFLGDAWPSKYAENHQQ